MKARVKHLDKDTFVDGIYFNVEMMNTDEILDFEKNDIEGFYTDSREFLYHESWLEFVDDKQDNVEQVNTKQESKLHTILVSDEKEVYRIGRYYIAVHKDKHVKEFGIGIARRSDLDEINELKGITIAQGRAEKAFIYKVTKRHVPSNKPFMG